MSFKITSHCDLLLLTQTGIVYRGRNGAVTETRYTFTPQMFVPAGYRQMMMVHCCCDQFDPSERPVEIDYRL